LSREGKCQSRITYLTEFNEHIASHRDAEVIRDDANDYVSMLCGKSQRIHGEYLFAIIYVSRLSFIHYAIQVILLFLS